MDELKIVFEIDSKRFEDKVYMMASDGWRLSGEALITQNGDFIHYYQAMARRHEYQTKQPATT